MYGRAARGSGPWLRWRERGPLTEDPSASRASALSAPPFDLTAIRDASTADCRLKASTW